MAQPESSRHVSGPELVHGLRGYALDQFGPLTKTVLDVWGVHRCRDFGEIVFNLIDYKVLSKTENDRREDFDDVYDFNEAFVRPFEPRRRPADPPSACVLSRVARNRVHPGIVKGRLFRSTCRSPFFSPSNT